MYCDRAIQDVIFLKGEKESGVTRSSEETVKFACGIGGFDLAGSEFGFVIVNGL